MKKCFAPKTNYTSKIHVSIGAKRALRFAPIESSVRRRSEAVNASLQRRLSIEGHLRMFMLKCPSNIAGMRLNLKLLLLQFFLNKVAKQQLSLTTAALRHVSATLAPRMRYFLRCLYRQRKMRLSRIRSGQVKYHHIMRYYPSSDK